ncbi:hypothetical protein DFAR_3480006 [Desulfarculales bacterium]
MPILGVCRRKPSMVFSSWRLPKVNFGKLAKLPKYDSNMLLGLLSSLLALAMGQPITPSSVERQALERARGKMFGGDRLRLPPRRQVAAVPRGNRRQRPDPALRPTG